MLYTVVQTFESVDEILKCGHSNERYRAVLSCGTVCCAVLGGSNFCVRGWNPKVRPFKWKLLSSTFYFAIQCGPNFWVCGWNPMVWPLKRNLFALFGSTFAWCYLLFSSLQNKIDKLCYILSRYTGFTIPVYYMFENESIGQLWRRMNRFFRHVGALLTFSPHLHWTKAILVVLGRIWFCYIPWTFSTSILEIRPETRESLTVNS